MTAWKLCSLLTDFYSILQEHVHLWTSTTNQRQFMLHTTDFRYAARKPLVYFISVFKVHHLKRGAWTVLYSTRKITKRNADFWKGSKTHTVNPNMIWIQILKLLVTWYPKETNQKLGSVFPGEISPIPPIVHWFWKRKSLGYNSQSIYWY